MKSHFGPAAVLIIFAILAVMPAWSSPGEVTADARHFVELLAKGDYAGAEAGFDATMKGAMPEAKLRETWQTVQTQVGRFQKMVGARASKLGGYDVVMVACDFERMKLDVKVVFDAKGLVAGLFFRPSQDDTAAITPPPYAPTNTFREKEFTVGQGEWKLPGTLTLPRSATAPCPAVVLVHGSGPNDRDETVGANKPFRDLAWGLAARGIAVLRYEKRTREYAAKFREHGIGHLTLQQETIDDALAAVARLRTTDGIDPNRVFVLGHSLGAMAAPRIGQADPKIAGLILMAGATRPLEDVIIEQTRYLQSLGGKPTADDGARLAKLEIEAAKIKKLTAADISPTNLLMGVPPAYWLDLNEHDPLVIAKPLKQPLYILQGARDYQVTTVDFDRWKEALGARPKVVFKLYPNLNHLFITGEGKSTPDEYDRPGYVAEEVVNDIAKWIGAR